jgi:hypothetical protein
VAVSPITGRACNGVRTRRFWVPTGVRFRWPAAPSGNRGDSFPARTGANPLVSLPRQCHSHANVNEVGPERVARALRKMAEDLVTERRRVVVLERENRKLRAQLEELQRVVAAEREPASGATHE